MKKLSLNSILKIVIVSFLTLPLLASYLSPLTVVNATDSSLQDQINQINSQLAALGQQKASIETAITNAKGSQSQYNNQIFLISRQADLLQNEINQKQLSIKELTLQLTSLNQSISDSQNVIASIKLKIASYNVQADKQLSQMYIDEKTHNTGIDLLLANGGVNIVKTSLYQKSAADDTNSALKNLNEQNTKLIAEEKQQEADKNNIATDLSQITIDQQALVTQKSQYTVQTNSLSNLLAQAQRSVQSSEQADASLSDQSQKLLAQESSLEEQAFNNSSGTPSNGGFVAAGTLIGHQGFTGLTTGPHLHFGVKKDGAYQNPCSYIPAGKIPGCAGNGELQFPFHDSSYTLTSGYGPRAIGSYTKFHYGLDIADYGNTNDPVYSAHSGYLHYGFEPCDPNFYLCKAGGANYVLICQNQNCNQGFSTLYYHLQEHH